MYFSRYLVLLVCIAVVPLTSFSMPKHVTDVFINGEHTLVYFNDGDTFRVLEGPLKGVRARMEGYNTLESYGAIHQWGEWTRYELFQKANESTDVARKGTWHCETDMDKDGYGRILAYCKDLALELVGQGLAHVMTVTKEPGRRELVLQQKKAIKSRIGFWEKGVPDYILTSAHSLSEYKRFKANMNIMASTSSSRRGPYDRFVSTKDGHSQVSQHVNDYSVCERISYIPSQQTEGFSSSSLLYVDFKHRYGKERADCLWGN